MITGTVNANGEPLIRLFVKGRGAILHEIEAVVDTGFNGDLTLGLSLITALGLTFYRQEKTLLADGTIIDCDVYEGIVLWDGGERSAYVQAGDNMPLVGTQLMDGYKLCVEM